MNCNRCGKPNEGSWCTQCLDDFETTRNLGAIYRPSVPADPYQVSDPQLVASQPLSQAPAWDPYSASVAAEERPKRPVGLVLALVAALVLVLLGGTYLLFSSGGTSQSAASQPGVAAKGEIAAAGPSTGEVQSESAETLDEATAIAGIEHYFSVVAGNPSAGWPLLSRARQAVENETSYVDFWSSVTSASVSDCLYDDAMRSVTCTLKLVKNGKETSTPLTLYVVLEDGVVKIDRKPS